MGYTLKKTLKNLLIFIVAGILIMILLDGATILLGNFLSINPETKVIISIIGLVVLVLTGVYTPKQK